MSPLTAHAAYALPRFGSCPEGGDSFFHDKVATSNSKMSLEATCCRADPFVNPPNSTILVPPYAVVAQIRVAPRDEHSPGSRVDHRRQRPGLEWRKVRDAGAEPPGTLDCVVDECLAVREEQPGGSVAQEGVGDVMVRYGPCRE
ncbi:hypothetical protein BG000_002909 [Podila horticola]|nr:hypothetical protein BG000_002909 [Podila horticola]